MSISKHKHSNPIGMKNYKENEHRPGDLIDAMYKGQRRFSKSRAKKSKRS